MLNLRLSKKLLLIVIFLAFQSRLNAQNCENFENIRVFQSDSTLEIRDIEIDANGNQYILGSYIGADSIGGFALAKMPTQAYAFFIAKRNSNGQFLWLKSITRNPSGIPNYYMGIEIGPQNELYYFSSIAGYIRFGNTLFENPDSSQLQSVVIKMDADGNIQSSLMFKSKYSPGNNFDNAVSINDLKIHDNKLYALGFFEDGMQVGNTILKANDFNRNGNFNYGTNSFVAKLSNDLTLDWITQVKNGNQRSYTLAVNSTGIYFTTFVFTSDGDSVRFGSQIISVGNREKTVLSKLNSQGQFQWSKLIPTSNASIFNQLACNNVSNTIGILLDADTIRVNSILRGTVAKTSIHLIEFNTEGVFQKHFLVPGFSQRYSLYKDQNNNYYVADIKSNIKLHFYKIDNTFNPAWNNGFSIPAFIPGHAYLVNNVKYHNNKFYVVGQIGSSKVRLGKFLVNANPSTKAAFIATMEESMLTLSDFLNITIKKNEQVEIKPILTGYSRVKWTPNQNINNDSVANIIASPTQTTTYSLKAFNSCGDSVVKDITITVDPASSVVNSTFEYSIYPNPNTQNFVITHSSNGLQILKIYNTLGQLVQQHEVYHNKQEINHHLTAGIYVIDFMGNKKMIKVD